MSEARELIEHLRLSPHPEGGWYRETWRAETRPGQRASGTAILFLLESGQSSHWHRVDAAEIWLWHRGDPIELMVASNDDADIQRVILGPNVLEGQNPQHAIEPHWWQAARPLEGENGYALVSCTVSPGFEFSGFELAPPDWYPGR